MNQPARRAALMGFLLIVGLPVAFAAEPMTKASGPSTLNGDDMEFFRKAAQSGMLAVQAAAIASTRAMASNTKDFANTMASTHGANNAALQSLAASKGVTLPTQLNEHHREMLVKLQKQESKDFDKQYAESMREAHREAIDEYKEAAKSSKDSDIRAFANNTLPTLQQHLGMLKK